MSRSRLFVFGIMVCSCVAGLLGPDGAMAEKRQILIAGGRTTSPMYAFAQALAKFINERSTWLRAETVSTAGLTGDADIIK
ncbi:MAG: hypothetical protein JRJ03_14060 [Deltaproteobacteria bacterium]|nr:hypothetical protein [Deltaproteobacteria bacterium]